MNFQRAEILELISRLRLEILGKLKPFASIALALNAMLFFWSKSQNNKTFALMALAMVAMATQSPLPKVLVSVGNT